MFRLENSYWFIAERDKRVASLTFLVCERALSLNNNVETLRRAFLH